MKAQAGNAPDGRVQRSIGAVLTTLVAVMLLASASTKLALPSVAGELAAIGIAGNRLTFVVMLEVSSALLFLIPITRSAGLLLVSAFMGGAIATHLQHSQSIAVPSMVLGLAWLGAWLRHPEMVWSWNSSRVAAR